MKKSVYLFMFILLIKEVYAVSDIQSFFTQNITNIDFVLLTIIFTAVIKLVLKGKFGEDGLANLLYLTLGIALSSASVFYGNISIYSLGMLILDLNQYIIIAMIIISIIVLYKVLPSFGPFKNEFLKFVASLMIVISLSEQINPGFLGGLLGIYINLSNVWYMIIGNVIILLVLWFLIFILLKFYRQLIGESDFKRLEEIKANAQAKTSVEEFIKKRFRKE